MSSKTVIASSVNLTLFKSLTIHRAISLCENPMTSNSLYRHQHDLTVQPSDPEN